MPALRVNRLIGAPNERLMNREYSVFYEFTNKIKGEANRISFARALIEVSSDSDLKKEVIMAIPNEEGTGGIKLSKPNPNFQYRPVPKPGKDMGDASNLGAKDQKEDSTSQSSFGKTSIVEDLW
nr:membrane transporter, TIM44-related/ribosomal protein L45 [Tanacetum cinerariifolium]